MLPADRLQLLNDLCHVVQAASVYPETHRSVQEGIARLHARIRSGVERLPCLRIGFLPDHVIVGEHPLVGLSPVLFRLIRRMRDRGMEKVSFYPAVTEGELRRFVLLVGAGREDASAQRWENISYGRFETAPGEEGGSVLPESDLSRSHLLFGATEVLKELLASIVAGGKSARVGDGRDIVAAVMAGLRRERLVVEHLMRMREHDDYTLTHSLNVCIIVTAQGMFLGLPEERLREIGLAALLHDTGKEVIRPEILTKPGRLDASEFSQMTEHPVAGARLLRKVDCGSELPMVVAFEHHIKHDRSGYPKIRYPGPLHPASVMTQIADVYDALRTYRPYRESIDNETVISILAKGRGTEFDPVVFDRFVAMVDPDRAPATADPKPPL
jgi:hypothetical protein